MRVSTLFVPIWGKGVRVHTHAARTVCAGTFRRERTVCAVSIAAATAQTRCAQTLDALSLPTLTKQSFDDTNTRERLPGIPRWHW